MPVPVGPVIYQIYVNGQLIPDRPLDVSLEQTWAMHDLFSIRIEYNRGYPMSAIVPWADNAPVQIVWGRRPNALQTWYGYVNHSEQASNADSGTHNLQYTYYVLGTSKPMNTENSFVWGNVSPTYIAKQMALRYHLRSVLTSTSWVLSNETQANMSDFAYLNYIAQKVGYRPWVSGGTLYFTDPAVILAGTARQGVPAYRQDKLMTQQDTMRDFKLLTGDNLPGSAVAQRQISGIDSTTGHLFTVSSGSGSISKTNTVRVAQSYGEASQIIGAWQNLSQFWIGATAELFGWSLLYPGKVIYLDGTALPGGNIGYWIVVSVKHILKNSYTGLATNDKYVTQVVVMRNNSGTLPKLKGTNVISPEFVPCTVNNGTWFSSSLQTIYDGAVNG